MTNTPKLKPCPLRGVSDLLLTHLVELQLFVSKNEDIMEDNGVKCFGYGDLLQAMRDITAWNTRHAPTVKPLVWVVLGDRWNTVTSGRIQITQHGCSPNWDLSCSSADVDGYFGTLEDAQVAAQAHHDSETLSALE